LKKAKKKLEIYKTPKILILHLKRFRTSKISSIGSYYYTSGSHKIDNNIEFPLRPLKLKGFIHSKEQELSDYELFAISNHYGGMHGGHYTAMCKNFNNSKWYEFNDARVDEIDEEKLVSEAAYLLFYRRIENNNDGK
jgi:ubiquitin carboxyl-terminal hydrolase 4/11/15